jgi:7,8-dihydropterin-6-yl-methyl-4-(beta-D-ribofuranosyl)aminobenzene 5'-phosphate synthase
MSLKITTLIENTPGEHLALKHEHGISFYIEKDGHTLLFDTGQSRAFIENARELRANLTKLEYVVLSHGHYDHSGGLRHLAKVTSNFEVIIGRGFFEPKYAYRNGSYEYLGNNFDEAYLDETGLRHRTVEKGLTELVPGVFIITDFLRTHEDEVINPRFKIYKNGEFTDDSFSDEVLVAVDTPMGVVVLVGCSHPGIKNMLDTVRARLKRPLHAVLGGTHLVEANAKSLDTSVQYLANSEMLIGVSHCTGETGMARLESVSDTYFHNRTGSSLFVQ